MNSDLKYIENLDKLARDLQPVGNARIASCIVYKREILAYGFNKLKSHPLQSKYSRNDDSIFLHSEVDCVINFLRNNSVDLLPKCTLYISRAKYADSKRRKFTRGLAKPCMGCNKCIEAFSIKRTVYTTDTGELNEFYCR